MYLNIVFLCAEEHMFHLHAVYLKFNLYQLRYIFVFTQLTLFFLLSFRFIRPSWPSSCFSCLMVSVLSL